MQKVKTPLVGAQGYQMFPLSKPVVGQNIALHAVPAYGASIYIPSFCLPGLFNFIFSKCLECSTVECVLNSEFLFVGGLHYVSPGYDTSRLTGRKAPSVNVLRGPSTGSSLYS